MPARKGEPIFRVCEECAAQYQIARKDQRFCSKPCAVRFRSRQNFRAHREAANVRRKRNYLANREEQLGRQKAKRAEDPEAYRARHRASYYRHREKRLAQFREYRRLHPRSPEERAEAHRKKRATKPWAQLLQLARRRAKQYGRAFELTEAWAQERWTGMCELSGLPFSPPGGELAFAATIDRRDSSLGYTSDNCRFVLFALNSIKGQGSDEALFTNLKVVAEAIIRMQRS